MIVGVGIDVVPVERFAESLRRTPGLANRIFRPDEQLTPSGLARTPESLAARFAAKEAVAKALGSPGGMQWQDCEIVSSVDGDPGIVVRGSVAAAAERRGIRTWHVSLSHDGGIASAMVVAEA